MPAKAKNHPMYSTWREMRYRCGRRQNKSYKNYGAKGVTVCDRWLENPGGFWNWVEDMGPKPTPAHSIERIDGTEGYSPSNCRWATVTEQNRNHAGCKLTVGKAAIVRAMLNSGRSQGKTAKVYGVSATLIQQIFKERRWSGVEPATLLRVL
jgi:hypothetical protein